MLERRSRFARGGGRPLEPEDDVLALEVLAVAANGLDHRVEVPALVRVRLGFGLGVSKQ